MAKRKTEDVNEAAFRVARESMAEPIPITRAKRRKNPAAVALHYMYYNFCRVHQTLRVTPAMEAGITDHVWSIECLVSLLDSEGNIVAA